MKNASSAFEPFFQVSQNTESASEGTGLGLAICEN